MFKFIAVTTLLIFNFPSLTKKVGTNQLIYGKWKVVESSLLPFEHISYCEKLGLNSIFEFIRPDIIRVYSHDSAVACNGIQKFGIRSDTLGVRENDFIFQYKLLKLTTDSLIIYSNRIPTYFYKEGRSYNKFGVDNDTLKIIREKGITIKLVKIDNGS